MNVTHHGFIIDTTKYSGNFEREMVAFMTGLIGECGVGDSEAETFAEDIEDDLITQYLEDNVMHVADEDNGCRRPANIVPTPGVWNNGMGGHFKDGEEDKALAAWKESWLDRHEKHLAHVRKMAKTDPSIRHSSWTDEVCDREIKDTLIKIHEVQDTETVSKYPAYQSVEIQFRKDSLTADVIKFLKTRAYEFAKESRDFRGGMITGFRTVDYGSVERKA